MREGEGRPLADLSSYPFVTEVRVRFADTDAMGVAHHASYLVYLEVARVEYLRSLGHPYTDVRSAGLDFPVAELAIRYLRPLRFDDLARVGAVLGEVRAASFRMDYLLAVDGEPCASASTRHAVVGPTGRPTRTPDWLRRRAPG